LAPLLQRPAPPPSPRPAHSSIIPPPTSTRVPKVVDSYRRLRSRDGATIIRRAAPWLTSRRGFVTPRRETPRLAASRCPDHSVS
jgi:hypothetical protein